MTDGKLPRPPGIVAELRFLHDLEQFRARVEQRSREFKPALKPLAAEIARRQAAGQNVSYSAQIYREIRWRVIFTPEQAATRARIADLQQSLANPADQSFAELQSPTDGSWGAGYTVWFFKL